MSRKEIKFTFNLDASVTLPSNISFHAKLKDGFENNSGTAKSKRIDIQFGVFQSIGYIRGTDTDFKFVVFCIVTPPQPPQIDDADKVHSNRVRFEFNVTDYDGTLGNPGIQSVTITDIVPLSKFRTKAKGFKETRTVNKNTIIIGAGAPQPDTLRTSTQSAQSKRSKSIKKFRK